MRSQRLPGTDDGVVELSAQRRRLGLRRLLRLSLERPHRLEPHRQPIENFVRVGERPGLCGVFAVFGGHEHATKVLGVVPHPSNLKRLVSTMSRPQNSDIAVFEFFGIRAAHVGQPLVRRGPSRGEPDPDVWLKLLGFHALTTPSRFVKLIHRLRCSAASAKPGHR